MSAIDPRRRGEDVGRAFDVDEPPPADRYGRAFVGSLHQARGRVSAVFVRPGRAAVSAAAGGSSSTKNARPLTLISSSGRPAKTERLLLGRRRIDNVGLAVSATDVGGARPRVPSFYVLDVMRAIVGTIPIMRAAARSRSRRRLAHARADEPRKPSTVDTIPRRLLIDTPGDRGSYTALRSA
jgi:hypothetical protein